MKNLTEYITEQTITLYTINESDDIIISEGFWSTVGSKLGNAFIKLGNKLKSWDNFDLKTRITSMVAVAGNNKEAKKEIKSITDALNAAENDEDALKVFKKYATKKIENNDLPNSAAIPIQVKNILANQKDDSEAQKLSKLLDKLIVKKYSKEDIERLNELYEKTDKAVEQKGINNTEDKDSESNEPSLGLSDDGKGENVTPAEQKKAVEEEIKDDKTFFIPLANEAGIDGNQLKDSIVGLINASLKIPKTNKKGETVYKWKADTKGFQTKNEDKLIKGLGALLCGLMMINHKVMNEMIIKVLSSDDIGFAKKDYLNSLLNNTMKDKLSGEELKKEGN